MRNYETLRTLLVATLVVGALSSAGPQVSYGEFTDGHEGSGSFTAASKYNGGGGGGGSCSQVAKHDAYADAGEDTTVPEGGQVILDGRGSCSNGGNIKRYTWEIDTDPEVGSLEDQTGQQEQYNAPSDVDGDTLVYVKLTVGNNKQDTDSDTVRITVVDQDGG